MARDSSAPVITASEIGQHAYCARSWWLGRVKGYAPANVADLEAGRRGHEQHGRLVRHARRWQYLAYALLSLALVVAVVAIGLLARGG
ncbi:MAG: hypothetical protein FJ026_15335 [Chloroflexi bacterium]|nr:hypothetical protein [Chloroflexota bacterium]